MQTLEEEILGMMRRLNAISRRQTKQQEPEMPPPPPMNGEPGEFPPPPPPEPGKKNHGRGRLVALLMDNGPMIQSQIAARMGIRPQSLSELICKAEADGMVTRRQSEEDKRQTIVSLTEKGRANVETFRSAHKQHAQDFLAPLTDDEKQQLASVLHKLIDARKEQED